MVQAILNNRGIKQAIEKKLLIIDPPMQDKQLQPASLDMCVDSVEDYARIDGGKRH